MLILEVVGNIRKPNSISKGRGHIVRISYSQSVLTCIPTTGRSVLLQNRYAIRFAGQDFGLMWDLDMVFRASNRRCSFLLFPNLDSFALSREVTLNSSAC